MDRRKFLQNTSAALLTTMTANAAVSKIRTGMLGTGHSHFGGKLKAMMDSPDYEIVGIVENDPGQRSVCKRATARLGPLDVRAGTAEGSFHQFGRGGMQRLGGSAVGQER